MPIENLNFQGINRAISDFGSTGACEELINLRPTTAGLVPVKPFSVKMEGVTYDKVYTHYAGATVNYIAVTILNGNLKIQQISEDGQTATSIFPDIDISTYTHFSLSDIHFATVGNQALFSIADKEDSFFKNISFLWGGNEYKPQEADAPKISAVIDDTQALSWTPSISSITPTYSVGANQNTIAEQINAALNNIQEENPDYCYGPVLIAIAFKTTDNKTFWTGNWRVYDPAEGIKGVLDANSQYIIERGGAWDAPSLFEDFFQQYEYGYLVRQYLYDPSTRDYFIFAGMALKLKISLLNNSWNPDTSQIQSVEIYTSRPQLYVDPSELYGDTKVKYDSSSNSHVCTVLPRIPYESMNLDGQLLYLQKSIPLAELSTNPVYPTVVPLSFGGNIQLTNETLRVDAGTVARFGDILAYNSRYHFYDSVARNYISQPSIYEAYEVSHEHDYDIYVVYNAGEGERIIYTNSSRYSDDASLIKIVIASNLRAIEVILVDVDEESQEMYYYKFKMAPSSTYNYSINITGYYETGAYQTLPPELQAAKNATWNQIDIEEPAAINVTEQFNPFVFNVKNSYLAPGKVLNLQPQLMAVADISIGDAPLDIFTNRGVYALLQGSGDVLYGAFRSLSNLVSTSNSIPTENGTFFIAAGGLWVIAGLHAVLVSDALSLGPHKYIRDNSAGYGAICNGVYNIQNYESKVSFEEFVKDAYLSYNRFRDELIISNPYYQYSYILSLKYRQWFKMGLQLSQDVPGSTIASIGHAPDTKVVAGLTAQAKINTNYFVNHSEESGDVEIEIYLHGASVDFLVTCSWTSFPSLDDIDEFLSHIVTEWNETFGDTIHAGTHTWGGDTYAYIPLTFVNTIPGVTSIDASVYLEAVGATSVEEDFEFPEPEWDVVDFSDETEDVSQLVHLQSRPFSIGYQYIHIHRVVSMIRAALGSSDKLIVALYGSDNLQDWTLLTFSDRSNVKISQIRTPSAARSWRYYTITIGGTTPVDTDFGTVMFDYQPVVRRIG